MKKTSQRNKAADKTAARKAASAELEISEASLTRRRAGRIALGLAILSAGIMHLTVARESFQAQVPDWQPFDPDFVVVASGVLEVALGGALVTSRKKRHAVGWIASAFFIAVYPGNISQLVNHVDSLGLDSDRKRSIRMPFQAVFTMWALWSTGAWRAWRLARKGRSLE